MKKRFISFLLAMIMVCSLAPMAFAATPNALEAADALHELGLFNGTGTNADGTPNYDLDRAPTRHEAVTMLVRLLGKEEEAKNGAWDIPFTDVADWAKPYVGYAYANNLTKGTSATTFGGNDTVTASQYITFVLRALGYESGTDFQWDKAWELSDQIGLTNGAYNAQTSEFVRGDVAVISESALNVCIKSGDKTLLETLGKERQETEATEEKPIQLSDAILGNWSYTIEYNGMVGMQIEYAFCEGNEFFGSRYTMDGMYQSYNGTYTLKGDKLTIDMDVLSLTDGKIVEEGNRQEEYTVQVVNGELALGDMRVTATVDLPLTDRVDEMVEKALLAETTPKLSASELRAIRVDVLKSWRNALVDMAEAGELCVKATVYAQAGYYTTAIGYARDAQVKCTAAKGETRNAINLCGDYDENADMKKALQDAESEIAQLSSFTLSSSDPFCLLEFGDMYLNSNLDTPNKIMEKWVQQIS